MCFISVSEVSGLGLATVFLSTLTQLGVNLNNVIGQGCNGAAVTSGEYRGIQTMTSEKYPKAQFVNCSSHVLNLAIGNLVTCQFLEIVLASLNLW